jgi:hypothetical protein
MFFDDRITHEAAPDHIEPCLKLKLIVVTPSNESETAMTDIPVTSPDVSEDAPPSEDQKIHEPRLWRDVGWTARVIKNDDDEGWAVEMIKEGESEPALVGPWTMGRDKKNPKPLDTAAFNTLVKTASEVLRRHEQQLHSILHKTVTVSTKSATVIVTLDIVPDEDDPYATLTAHDDAGAQLSQVRVVPNFVLTRDSAAAWIENDFRRPG